MCSLQVRTWVRTIRTFGVSGGTHDRMTTTAGSLALEGSIPQRDAFLVERLRVAGAILLGKTNLSEWANFRSTHSSSSIPTHRNR